MTLIFQLSLPVERRIRLMECGGSGGDKKKNEKRAGNTMYRIRTYLHVHPPPTNRIKIEEVRVVFGRLILIRFRL